MSNHLTPRPRPGRFERRYESPAKPDSATRIFDERDDPVDRPAPRRRKDETTERPQEGGK